MIRPDTTKYRLLEMIGMCGEFPADQLNRLIPSASYAEKLITDLKAEHLIRTHYRDALRGYRLTKAAKEMLLSVSPLRFQCYLTGNTEQNPLQLFSTSVKSGRYKGFGWSHETLAHYAHVYGVQTQWFSGDETQICEYLKAGKPVIAHMGPGVFTDVGHFIVLRGVTESGKILVNDPNSRENCALAFPLSLILSQTKGEDPFMACWLDA